MKIIKNPLRGQGLPSFADMAEGHICTDPAGPIGLFARCPIADKTLLLENTALADTLGIAKLHLKDERSRMGLGSFKALGAAYAIAKLADAKVEAGEASNHQEALAGTTFICASAGNHGLSMAAGAKLFGADAVVYLSNTVPEGFAERLRQKSARVVREGDTYEASMAAAMAAADENGWNLLSDSSWLGYSEPARDVMEGYLVMGAEVADQLDQPPTHIFLQAGVGGLAAACTAAARHYWGESPAIIVVEPEYAPALIDSIEAGKPVVAKGPVSNMGRLDCKEPSHLALKYLAVEADFFMTISEEEALNGVAMLSDHGIDTSPSGVAGFAGLLSSNKTLEELGIDQDSRVLVYISEGPADE